MTNASKQWQASIQHKTAGADTEQIAIVYGASLPDLKAAALVWFREQQPMHFQRDDHIYFSSDGKNYPISQRTQERHPRLGPFLEEGWFLDEHSSIINFKRLPNFEAAMNDFLEKHLIPEPGPEFQNLLVQDGVLQLHLVKTIHRESDEAAANRLLRRGWVLLSLNNIEYSDFSGDKTSETRYVLGHQEEQALYYKP